jgi:nucleoside-diphosphate-sugar epimerase
MAFFQEQTAFVYGCGYLGLRVAKRLLAKGWNVYALTRSEKKARWLADGGITPFIGDWTDARSLERIPATQRVLVAVGYDSGSSQLAGRKNARYLTYVEGLRRAIPTMHPQSQVVYVSSTGVFHQADGSWVDEASPARPSGGGGEAHLHAEELLLRARRETNSANTTILRMAGLYGPGRVPRVESIRRGEAIAVDPDSYLNLIHIEDAASCVMAAWERPISCSFSSYNWLPHQVYLIADGHPVLRRDYYAEIARLINAPAPQFAAGDMTTSATSRASRNDSNKRIWNARMRRDLLPRCQFPDYKIGLDSLLRISGGGHFPRNP